MTHPKDSYLIKKIRKSNRIFKKFKVIKHQEPPMTDAEIDEIRERMGIKLNDPKKYRMGGHRGAL